MSTFSDNVDRMIKQQQEAEQIKCPGCGYVFDQEDLQGHVTYWGDGDKTHDGCPSCEACLEIDETVIRSFEVCLLDTPDAKGTDDA